MKSEWLLKQSYPFLRINAKWVQINQILFLIIEMIFHQII
jgi:hypothetical protein